MRSAAAFLLLLPLAAQDPEAWKPRADGSQLSLEPAAPRVLAGRGLAFTVRRSGPDRSILQWQATGGQVDAQGRWVAPRIPGRYVVSVQGADPSLSARATVEVTWEASLGPVADLRPVRTALLSGQTFAFQLAVHGLDPRAARWTATGGTVDGQGRFTAGSPGKARVLASWPGGPSVSADIDVVAPAPRHVLAYLLLKDLAAGAFRQRDLSGLTHACLSFVPIHNGEIQQPAPSDAAFGALPELRRRHPALKVLASVGGWGALGFSELAATPEGRQRFAASAVRLLEQQKLDGLDLDWEYPTYAAQGGRPGDRETYVTLLQTMRQALQAASARLGRPLLLTAAVPAGPDQADFYDWPRVLPLLDLVNLMTYDYHGPYEPFTAFHAPLRSVREEGRGRPDLSLEATVKAFLARGADPARLVLGLPFYGKVYRASGPRAGDPAQGAGPASYLAAKGLAAYTREGGWARTRHPEAAQLTLWHPERRLWINIDDEESLRLKAAFALQEKLGGVMFWELAQDEGPFLRVLAEAFPRSPAQAL